MKIPILPPLLLAAGLAAQVPEPPPPTAEEAKTAVAEADGTNAQPDADRNLLIRYMGIVPSTRPHRLAPGETGSLVLVLSLLDHSVLVSGQKLSIEFEPKQGPVTIGQWQVHAPKPAVLYPQLASQSVHEKYAIVEFPIAIDGDAKHGKYPLAMKLEAQIHDGRTGNALALARGEVKTEVVVGPPVPRAVPIQAPPAERGDSPDIAAPGAARDANGAAPPDAGAPPAELGGRMQDGGAQEPPARDAGAEVELPQAADAQGDYLLLGLCAFAGLGLLAILLHRLSRRS
jgi:hypothetical protein